MSSNRPPSRLLTLLETRAAVEYGLMRLASPVLKRMDEGDGHPVLVMPGFTSDDQLTRPLRRLLSAQGYAAYGWGLGRNLGPTEHAMQGIRHRLDRLAARYGRPVSLIGWSLGGIYARVLARETPELVRTVITMGSPFKMGPEDRSAASSLFDSLSDRFAYGLDFLTETEQTPLTVPATSIYTKTDGIVHWYHCLDESHPRAENIEVYGSHCGLGYNPVAAFIISDRLRQPSGTWEPFTPPLWLRPSLPLLSSGTRNG